MSGVINLGIGSGGTIPELILFGLEPEPTAEPPGTGPSQMISLGIGSPAGIAYFIRFGLGTQTHPGGIGGGSQGSGPRVKRILPNVASVSPEVADTGIRIA